MGLCINHGPLDRFKRKNPKSRALGLKDHECYSMCAPKPYYLGPWTLWIRSSKCGEGNKRCLSRTFKMSMYPLMPSLNPKPWTLNPAQNPIYIPMTPLKGTPGPHRLRTGLLLRHGSSTCQEQPRFVDAWRIV